MEIKLLTTLSLPLDPQLQWLWYSRQSASFITGDERAAYAIPTSNPHAPVKLPPAQEALSPSCNLPVTRPLYEEFCSESWHGFKFLDVSAYQKAVDSKGQQTGDLLRTLVFGPDYGQCVLDPASGLILSLRSGSMELLERTADGLRQLDKTKTRGRAALAFAAHPTEKLIVYGDNYGTFHAHRFDETAFGRANKIADKPRKASRVEFVSSGQVMMAGGMGYLASYSYAAGKFTPRHEISIPVRDFACVQDGELLLVNQGMHGIAAYHHDQNGITKLADTKTEEPVGQIAVSHCLRYLAATAQGSARVAIYAMNV
jgi:hypothetical protein